MVTPNDTSLPPYATLNLSVTQRVPINGSKGTNVRFDVINVTDGQYQSATAPESASARRNSACAARSS